MLKTQIEKTRKITLTRRLMNFGKNEEDTLVCNSYAQEGHKQLLQNHAAMNFIDFWDLSWKQSKAEYGSYFLKQWATRIDLLIENLITIGKKLGEETVELEVCITQKPKGVWI
ncbi:hypothetical protein F442_09320 [Phytophthora nicotianae P10297]|uniref:Uncharacterized protein n=3 Tax=Phytophthora nicotianae TaxID=4792 RepID=V9F744_PHYNI|nr:hypothetical protein F443_09396 [Phytophthora nicotianae P1569]ETO74878.1 hypothetical protein F444_09483 [Phytophthora nicotianae P1976]ETP44058.1 hypothetical protein F442_09320 [Phytophthora nicotianae P10297]